MRGKTALGAKTMGATRGDEASDFSLDHTDGGPQRDIKIAERIVSFAVLISTLHAYPACVRQARDDPK